MDITLTLALPRDGVSVPVARRMLKESMSALGVDRAVSADIELALTEACTNVLDHATDGEEYEVRTVIHDGECIIEVVDRGGAFEHGEHGFGDAETSAESGRGIQLMRALVDHVSFARRDEGNVVHLEKRLAWDDSAPIALLTERRAPQRR